MPEKQWAIQRQLPGGTDTDWVEICRCETASSVAAIIAAILSATEPPDRVRIIQVVKGM